MTRKKNGETPPDPMLVDEPEPPALGTETARIAELDVAIRVRKAGLLPHQRTPEERAASRRRAWKRLAKKYRERARALADVVEALSIEIDCAWPGEGTCLEAHAEPPCLSCALELAARAARRPSR